METKSKEKVTVPLPINADDLWSGVFDNLWEPWWKKLELVADANERTMRVSVWDADAEDYTSTILTKEVTLQDLADAYGLLLGKGQCHCFGIPLEHDPTEFDACGSDFVLQTAVFGKVVFG